MFQHRQDKQVPTESASLCGLRFMPPPSHRTFGTARCRTRGCAAQGSRCLPSYAASCCVTRSRLFNRLFAAPGVGPLPDREHRSGGFRSETVSPGAGQAGPASSALASARALSVATEAVVRDAITDVLRKRPFTQQHKAALSSRKKPLRKCVAFVF